MLHGKRSGRSIFATVTRFKDTRRPALWLVFFITWLACRQPEMPAATAASPQAYQDARLKHYRDSIFPMAYRMVRNGDLVLRLGSDITSEMIRQLNQTDPSFSHCGLASIENDTVFVYHAIGGEFNPDQKLKRESLYAFCHPAANKALAVFRPTLDAMQVENTLLYARTFYQGGVPFDMAFDYDSDDKLYCAEFVAKCLSRALRDSSWVRFSQAGSFRYISVDNLFTIPMMQEIGRLRF